MCRLSIAGWVAEMAAAHRSVQLRQIQRIQILRRELHMDDDAYRAMLLMVTGKLSAKDLDATERTKVINHLVKCGAGRTRPAVRLLIGKLTAMWHLLGAHGHVRDTSRGAMEAWCRNQVPKLKALQWADTRDLNAAVEAMKKWCQRLGAVEGRGGRLRFPEA